MILEPLDVTDLDDNVAEKLGNDLKCVHELLDAIKAYETDFQ